MKMPRLGVLGFITAVVLAVGCDPPSSGTLVVYSGRSKALVEPLVQRFREATGVQVEVKYGGSAELASLLLEEGSLSPADVFWAQDAGALGAVHAAGMLALISDELGARVDPEMMNDAGTWVATSGRARTLAYSSERTADTKPPASVFDLTHERFFGRIGWAPSNGSFQAFVTAMRNLVGEEVTRTWLGAMKANGAKDFPNNSSIVQAIANGEIDYGLPNHYYLYRFKASDPSFPVDQTFFIAGDPGNLLNVAGAAVLKTSANARTGFRFVEYLLSDSTQAYFARETHEYPVVRSAVTEAQSTELEKLQSLKPPVDLDGLRDLDRTLQMLRGAGVL